MWDEIGPLNKILINPFVIIEIESNRDAAKFLDALKEKEISAERKRIDRCFVQGTNQLCSFLVRAAAQRIYLSKHVPDGFPKIDDYLKMFPESLAQRIEIIDKDDKSFQRVEKYLEPILNDLERENIISYNRVLDFLYKILLASGLGAEAEMQIKGFSNEIIDLINKVKNEEAKFRLNEILGIYNLYNKKQQMQTISLYPNRVVPSICERVDELLKNSEIINLSKSRHLLGIPGKSKAALLRIRRNVNRILENEKYSKDLKSACDIIKIAGTMASGIPIPIDETIEILKTLQTSPYNPPLIDLSHLKSEIAEKGFGGHRIAYMESTATDFRMALTPEY